MTVRVLGHESNWGSSNLGAQTNNFNGPADQQIKGSELTINNFDTLQTV
jgi:hypothetical protein